LTAKEIILRRGTFFLLTLEKIFNLSPRKTVRPLKIKQKVNAGKSVDFSAVWAHQDILFIVGRPGPPYY